MAAMEKAGVPTELRVRHPLGKLLIWVNFVLMEYSSGAVMSVLVTISETGNSPKSMASILFGWWSQWATNL